jgi:hypothetical protein
MRPLPPLPPPKVWRTYTQEQQDAFWAECRKAERSVSRFLLAWQILFLMTIAAGIAAVFMMIIPMLEFAYQP